MRSDSLITVIALVLQMVGWASLMGSRWSQSRRGWVIGESMVVACLAGLGFLTLAASSLHLRGALGAGLHTAVLLLGTLGQIGRDLNDNPYLSIETFDGRAEL